MTLCNNKKKLSRKALSKPGTLFKNEMKLPTIVGQDLLLFKVIIGYHKVNSHSLYQ